MNDMPRIHSVSPVGPTSLALEWCGGRTSVVDLADWLNEPNPVMEALSDPAIFVRATIGAYGSMITWDNGEGDLAIDAVHLEMIAEKQALSAQPKPLLAQQR